MFKVVERIHGERFANCFAHARAILALLGLQSPGGSSAPAVAVPGLRALAALLSGAAAGAAAAHALELVGNRLTY
jgi:hypothetical protein